MGTISLCFDLSFHTAATMSDSSMETIYQNSYKKLMSFLYTHPKCCFSFYFSGSVIEWFDKEHPEMLSIISALTNRKQVEILGGGYYDPYFPLIQPIDRVGQTELLTTAVRKAIGKRPRGMKLVHSAWDPSLVSSFKTCGMEYVLLDYRLLRRHTEKAEDTFQPYMFEDLGKTIVIIPQHPEKCPDADISPAEYIKQLAQNAKDKQLLVSCSVSPEKMAQLLQNGWLENLFAETEKSDQIVFTLPSKYLKTKQIFPKTDISAGCSPDIAQWTVKPYSAVVKKQNTPVTIRNFLQTYPEIAALYSRMMYTCMLVSQCRGDRMRKKAAREELWQAQNFSPFSFTGNAGSSDKYIRQAAYHHLIQAEKFIAESNGIVTFCAGIDFDMDGTKSYIFKYPAYTAFLSQKDGSLFELDISSTARNYSDTIKRRTEFDAVEDLYPKKIFTDHLVEIQNFESFTHESSAVPAVFCGSLYTEHSFDRSRHEIQFITESVFGPYAQPVQLKKNFTCTESGIQVQYILKNCSPLPLKARFVSEIPLCLPGNSQEEQLIEIISSDTRLQACPDQLFVRQHDVSHVQIADLTANVLFTFEPNENAGIILKPLDICNPADAHKTQYQATAVSFFWNIDLAPGLETEKTLFLGMKTPDSNTPRKKKRGK